MTHVRLLARALSALVMPTLALAACSDDAESLADPGGSTTAAVPEFSTGPTISTAGDDGVEGGGPDADSGGTENAGPDDSTGDGSPGEPACEADVVTDATNCGACGHDCLGGLCTSGRCEPRRLIEGGRQALSFGVFDLQGSQWVRLNDTQDAWDPTTVGGYSIGSHGRSMLAEAGVLATDNDNVVLAPLQLAKFDGTTELLGDDVASDFDSANGVVAYSTWQDLSSPDNEHRTVFRRDVTGGAFESIIDGPVRLINVSDEATFVRQQTPGEEQYTIVRIPHGATESETVYTGPEYVDYVWLGDSVIYFRDTFVDEVIFRVSRGAAEPEIVMAETHNTDEGRGSAVLVDDKLLYVHANEVRWVDAVGDVLGTTLASFPEPPRSMAIIDDALMIVADDALYRLVLPTGF